jgi:outer membrane murein-binding lipoprotein Lpp
MKRTLLVFFLVILGALSLQGESRAAGNAKVTVEELLERIQKLEQRVDELQQKLQAKQDGAPPPAAAASSERVVVAGAAHSSPMPLEEAVSTAPAIEQGSNSLGTKHLATQAAASASMVESKPEQAAATAQGHEHTVPVPPENMSEVQTHYPSLAVRGFSNIDFSAQDATGSKSGFDMGQFVIHLSGALSEKVSYFGELSLTATPGGYNAEVERSLIRYDYNDHLKVSFGRYHTPINYWNTAFHHGLWLQTTVARPEMIKFGGRLVPVHFVGALVEGTIPGTGSLNLNYLVGLGNGRGSIISRAGDAGDTNNNRAWLVTLYSRPDWAYGWQVGGSVYGDKINLAAPNQNVREWIESAHVVYTRGKPELLAEFANVHHNRIGTPGVSDSQAWYVQLAYRLRWFEQDWKPYYRFEYIHVPASDPVFTLPADLVRSFNGSVVGVRYDISRFAALKAEYRNSRQVPGEPRVNGAFLQTAFTF